MATLSSILVLRTPWTDEPGGLQSIWSERVGHNRSNLACRHRHTNFAVSRIEKIVLLSPQGSLSQNSF